MTKIEKYRLEKGLSQKEIAEILGTTPQNISNFETTGGIKQIKVVRRYADILGVHPLDIFK